MQSGNQPAAADLLVHLQQRYGNQYVGRVVSLAAQRENEAEAPPEIESAIERERGGGVALDKSTQSEMGAAFGTDFSAVKIHTDPTADALNRAVGAVAFTIGRDIFFSQGAYQPQSSAGKELLGHELTHVVQQGAAGSQTHDTRVQGKLMVSDPEDASEREAEQMSQALRRTAESGSGGTLQRDVLAAGF